MRCKILCVLIGFLGIILFSDCSLQKDFSYEIVDESVIRNQSAACFDKFVFLISDKMSRIQVYDMDSRKIVLTKSLEKKNLMKGKSVVYHCNQSCFGVDKFNKHDFFPLIYISQRSKTRSSGAFVEVYRIVADFGLNKQLIDFNLQLVQVINLPPMTSENGMGNPNAIIDPDHRRMYIYGRFMNAKASNHNESQITCFKLPSLQKDNKEITLSMDEAEWHVKVGKSLLSAQGGIYYKNKLYIATGYPSTDSTLNFIHLNVYDVRNMKHIRTIDMKRAGIEWEPEGLWMYKKNMYMSTNGKLLLKLNNY